MVGAGYRYFRDNTWFGGWKLPPGHVCSFAFSMGRWAVRFRELGRSLYTVRVDGKGGCACHG